MSLEEITQKLNDDINAMIEFLQSSKTDIENGTPAPLDQLDNRVIDICRRVEALPQEEGKKFQELLNEMIGKLDELAETIKNNAEIF